MSSSDVPQVLLNGVSVLTLLMDAHMKVSAIRFYLLSLVISGNIQYSFPPTSLGDQFYKCIFYYIICNV